MLFNSIDFAIFFPVIFILYWLIPAERFKQQNLLICLASYIFYGWWDWRFLLLIFFSTVVDYYVAAAILRTHHQAKRKFFLTVSLLVNLGVLGFFKYCNFFLEAFRDSFSLFGFEIAPYSLNILLPVGISFYTFQTLSYTIDVYRKKLSPTHDFIAFSSYVSFFPQLVAGPIERATHLLPQFQTKRRFEYAKAVDGMRQILWGLLKKLVIADNCAKYVNIIFANTSDYSGSTLALGAVLFSFQIYGDFSGYSDIAIGTARLLGFDLMRNFAFPYFSRDIAEFWRRWHISLSTWFRDYLYIPLGGSRIATGRTIRNIFVIFLVSGFWHGANWTFIVWGLLHAIYFLPLLLVKKNRVHLGTVAAGRYIPSFGEFFLMSTTFFLTSAAWIFFRADNLEHALFYYSRMFNLSLFTAPELFPRSLFCLLVLFVSVEWLGREGQYAIANLNAKCSKPARNCIYLAIVFTLFYFTGDTQEFIYFQF